MNIQLPAATGLAILAELYAEDRIEPLDDVTLTRDEWEHIQQLFGLVVDDGTPGASIFGVPIRWTPTTDIDSRVDGDVSSTPTRRAPVAQ